MATYKDMGSHPLLIKESFLILRTIFGTVFEVLRVCAILYLQSIKDFIHIAYAC